MNRFLLLIGLFAIISVKTTAQRKTYYYQLEKIVNGNRVNTKVKGGQYITFLNVICYESNSQGMNVGHGTMRRKGNSNGHITYEGSSYWGNNSSFVFDADLSRMNVQNSSGDIYYYIKATPPEGEYTCSLIRENGSSGGGGGTPIVTPTPIQPIQGGNVTPITPIGGHEVNPSTPSKRWKNVRRTYDCDRCHHSGKCQTCNGKGWYQGTYGPIDCPNCDGYKTGRCSKCHGSGTIEKMEQVYE